MEDEGTIITMLEGAHTESNEVSWSARGGGGGAYTLGKLPINQEQSC